MFANFSGTTNVATVPILKYRGSEVCDCNHHLLISVTFEKELKPAEETKDQGRIHQVLTLCKHVFKILLFF